MTVDANKLPLKNKGITRVLKAGIHSLNGLKAAFKHEEAFQQEVIIGIVCLISIPFLPTNPLESAVLVMTVFLVWITELLNSGLEWTIDYISQKKHPYAKKVKDMGSAAVLASLVMLLSVWLIILIPHFA